MTTFTLNIKCKDGCQNMHSIPLSSIALALTRVGYVYHKISGWMATTTNWQNPKSMITTGKNRFQVRKEYQSALGLINKYLGRAIYIYGKLNSITGIYHKKCI